MKHVFVETNWVVAYAAPSHLRTPSAVTLVRRAEAGELQIHLPSICLTEARTPIRTKFNPRSPADSVRKYIKWATEERTLAPKDSATVRRVLDRYEAAVNQELGVLDNTLESLRSHPGIDIFPLGDKMLNRVVELAAQINLKPFDQAILAAVLVRAEALRDSGADDISFCELDGDLQPWDKDGRSTQPLTSLYDAAAVWVYSDFEMENPPRRPNFPEL